MSRFRFESSLDQGTLHLRLRGTLDGSSAWELRHAMEEAKPTVVILDFGGIAEVWDFGAAVLSAGLRLMGLHRLLVLDAPKEVRDWLDRYAVQVEVEMAPEQIGMHPGGLPV